jgi:hypothetical protein
LGIQDDSPKPFFAFRPRFLFRFALVVSALILICGLAAPFVNADAFRGTIQNSLEETLGRKVEIEKVRFTLFTGPGFTLEGVTIPDDPRYGLEPFAYVPTLEVRVRLDKLLLGEIRPLGLRMIDASLNLVKSEGGTWNAVGLVERLGAPRRAPLNFFPAVQISNGRVDFKLGTRKTTLYITDTDVSVYPESSGKIYFKFEGSPARTDRAGNGFGHLAGTANWYLKPATVSGNQLEADVNLQPSNLSELATLLQGQDMGVHGNVSAHILISGPFSDLRALGDVRLDDVHRWDLLPSPGDNWRVHFRARVDLETHQLELATLPESANENPAMLQLHAKDFMTHPAWSVLLTLQKAPLASLLPLAKRMGMGLPAGLSMDGALDGVVGFSNATIPAGARGLEGGVVITDAVANIPGVPPLRSASATVTISGDKIHIEPANLQSDTGGTLSAGGDFDLGTQDMTAEIGVDTFSIPAFKQTVNAWFGVPDALALMEDGDLSGHFLVNFPANGPSQIAGLRPTWSGQAQVEDATLNLPGATLPVKQLQGKAIFDEATFDLPHMSGVIGDTAFAGSYHYAAGAKHTERLRLEIEEADLEQLESDLGPTLGDDGLLSRLALTRRSIPAWLTNRSMEGDVAIDKCSLNQVPLGEMSTHFVWQGTNIQLTNLKVRLPAGKMQGSGSVALGARLPRYHLELNVDGFPWSGGVLSATGDVDTSGMGVMALQHTRAAGEFSGQGISLGNSGSFSTVSGQFTFAFNESKPSLTLTRIEAHQGDESWVGEGTSNPEGKLRLDLTSGDRPLHLVTELTPPATLP